MCTALNQYHPKNIWRDFRIRKIAKEAKRCTVYLAPLEKIRYNHGKDV